MSDLVLVHGSFGGGWVWADVAKALRADGHTVHTPTLTGVGERAHLVGPFVGLSVNVRDVVNVLEYRDLSDVVLVGHSYAGMVITGVAEACADRIDRLVYFDGYLPEDGQSAWDITPDAHRAWEDRAAEAGPSWLVPPPDPAEKYGESGARVERQRELMTPMAMWTHAEPIRLPADRAKALPRSYVECLRYETFAPMGEKARAAGLDYHRLDTHHNPIFHEPERATAVLREAIADD